MATAATGGFRQLETSAVGRGLGHLEDGTVGMALSSDVAINMVKTSGFLTRTC